MKVEWNLIILDALSSASNQLPSPAVSSSLAALESDHAYWPHPYCFTSGLQHLLLGYHTASWQVSRPPALSPGSVLHAAVWDILTKVQVWSLLCCPLPAAESPPPSCLPKWGPAFFSSLLSSWEQALPVLPPPHTCRPVRPSYGPWNDYPPSVLNPISLVNSYSSFES